MQPHVLHRYVAELRLAGGQVVTTPALQIDWTPAVEWRHFQEVRRGAAGLGSVAGRMCVRPQWDAHAGPPRVASIEVAPWNGSAGRPRELPLKYLAGPVHQSVSALVEAGRIEEGTKYTWRICAYEADAADVGIASRDAFNVREECGADDVAGSRRRLRDLLRHARHRGPVRGRGDPRDFPVFISQSLLAEAADTATAAGELEAGGLLLGRFSRNDGFRDLILEVTAQVPAREAVAEDASLRFTPRTWQAVHAAIGLRRASEGIVGWWHSHPRKVWLCNACPPERRARCPLNRPFFSAMDIAFHRTAFQGPVNVALLFSFHEDRAPRQDLFGWRHGLVAERAYYVLEQDT